jgi:hypothetical protein
MRGEPFRIRPFSFALARRRNVAVGRPAGPADGGEFVADPQHEFFQIVDDLLPRDHDALGRRQRRRGGDE